MPKPQTPPEKQDYRALFDGRVAGRAVAQGDILRLTPEEARYEAVEPVRPADMVAADVPAAAKGAKAKA